jgi:hypothetical protein
MLKTILAFIAMALLVDAVAFDSYYRIEIIHELVILWGRFVALDWAGFLT